MKIYKYCGPWGVDIVRLLQFRVTPPDQFNDPFEFMPGPKGSFRKSELPALLDDEELLRQFLNVPGAKEAGVFDIDSCRRHLQDKIEDEHFTDDLMTNFQATETHKLCRDLCKKVSEDLGLICFTTQRDNLLMWSHYADGHKGVVIGFDSDHPFFQIPPGFRPVEYSKDQSDERFHWDFSLNPGDEGYDAMSETFVVTKSRHWCYEDEKRMLIELKGLKRRKLKNGVLGYFVDIPADLIDEVILGYRCQPETEQNLRESIKLHGLPSHGLILRAEPHPTRFALSFESAD
jgi:hypothetical protein